MVQHAKFSKKMVTLQVEDETMKSTLTPMESGSLADFTDFNPRNVVFFDILCLNPPRKSLGNFKVFVFFGGPPYTPSPAAKSPC